MEFLCLSETTLRGDEGSLLVGEGRIVGVLILRGVEGEGALWIPETGGIRHSDTVKFSPQKISFPSITISDYLHQAATNILTILQDERSNIPSLMYGDITSNAYIDIAKIIQCATKSPSVP